MFSTAIGNGAERGSVRIQNFDKTPINYVPGECIRYQIKAVGKFSTKEQEKRAKEWNPSNCQLEREDTYQFSTVLNEFDPKEAKKKFQQSLSAPGTPPFLFPFF